MNPKAATQALLALILTGRAVAATPAADNLRRCTATQPHMGTQFTIVVYAADTDTGAAALDTAFSRIRELDQRLSDYKPDSEISQLSRGGPSHPEDKPVARTVSDDLWRVLCHADSLNRRTDGAFDITVGPLSRLWRRAQRTGRIPQPERLAAARAVVGHRWLKLDRDRRRVALLKSGMKLDLGAIAKGFAADEAIEKLRRIGVNRALIDCGGDIVMSDPPPGKPGWKIAISTPFNRQTLDVNRSVTLSNRGVATSGDVWQFVEQDGKRYSHIIDPRTGMGISRRIQVSIVAPTGIAADSLASAVSVLGVDRGIELIESIPQTEAYIAVMEDDQSVVHTTKAFPFDKTGSRENQSTSKSN